MSVPCGWTRRCPLVLFCTTSGAREESPRPAEKHPGSGSRPAGRDAPGHGLLSYAVGSRTGGGVVLREEQIDIRRRRAIEGKCTIKNLGRTRVFSEYQVVTPVTGGRYQVSIRGFEVGDNACTCPDFRTNTLGTCKHVEAVLAALREET